jgi:phage terminase large subunit GpA-like protein
VSDVWDDLRDAWRSAIRPPERYLPSEWAERFRMLPNEVSAEPGKYRLERTPYARGILDAAAEPSVEEIWVVAGTQIGKTTIEENLLGHWVDNDPGPCLIVKPSEAATEEAIKERWRPLLEKTPSLARHLSDRAHDNTLRGIKLDTMPIYFGWAGSPQSLASRPCRYVLADECDKFPPFAGREADPISLARERTATYGHRRRLVAVSTPTTRTGTIWRGWESCGDRRRFHVPCPHCGTFQVLAWPQVKWPKLPIPDRVAYADEIERLRLAWYECNAPDCRGRIEDAQRTKMLAAGVWASEGQTVNADGTLQGERPVSKRVGFHLSSLYSPWRRLWEMAAEFIRADGDVAATMNFRNSRLAEPFELQVSKREPSKIAAKAEAAKLLGRPGEARVVPAWAVLLIATADVQKDHLYWQVDAWGYEQRSKRVMVGVAASLDEVYRQVFAPDVPYQSEAGGPVFVQTLVVDSGFRKDEVTEFARRDPGRVHIAKGLSTYFGPIAEQKVEKASGVTVWNINTKQSKDTLDRLIGAPEVPGDPDGQRWQVYAGIGDEFCSQVSAEHKILDPQTRQEVWVKKTSGAANHWWDCSAMSTAVATAMGAAMAKPAEPAPTSDQHTQHNGVGGSGWVTGHRGRY